MNEMKDDVDMMFYSLVLSLQASAMQHLGKVMSPLSGKVVRNLEAGKHTIDMLEMIRRKTDGNLNDDEKNTLERILYELRLNYVDEAKKGPAEPPQEPEAESAKPESPESGAGEKTPEEPE